MKKLLCLLFAALFSMTALAEEPQPIELRAAKDIVCWESEPDTNKYTLSNTQCSNNGSSAYNRHVLYQFDFDSVQVPEGYSIGTVTFHVYVTANYKKDQAAFPVVLYPIVDAQGNPDTSWDPQTVTHNTMPTVNKSRILATATVPQVMADDKSVNQYIGFDITSYTKEQINQGHSAITFAMIPQSNGGDFAFDTGRGSQVPYMTVEFVEESVTAESIQIFRSGNEVPAMFVGENQYVADAWNYYSQEKTVRLVGSVMGTSRCEAVAIGEPVTIAPGENAQVSLTVTVPRTGQEVHLFLVEEKNGGFYPIANKKDIATKTGWQ